MKVITIQAGDSLYKIGKQYGVSVEQLVEANGIDPHKYLVIGDSLIVPSAQEKNKTLEVNGYAYPFIDRAVLEKTLPYLTYLSIFSYGITDAGDLVPPPLPDQPLIQAAKAKGVAPLLVLTTVDESGGFNSERSVSLLESDQARANLAAQLKKVIVEKGYYGVDVDMEYIPGNLRQDYTDLVAYLKEQLAPAAVFVALAPKTSGEQRGLLYEAHDYEGMGKAADRTLIMTYEWGYAFGPPMAVAPLPNVRRVMDYALQEIPPEKLLMGIANYGYDWKIPFDRNFPARSIGNYEAVAIARKYGANIQYDPTAQAPWFRYYDVRRQEHEVWFEDARSYLAKMNLVKELGIQGISIWNVMRWYKPLYSIIDSLFDIRKIKR